MDYHIKDIDGIQVTQIIKSSLKRCPYIIAYTGDKSSIALNKFKQIGMNGVLIKPVNVDLIENLITELSQNNIVQLKKLSQNHKNYIYFN